MLDKISEPDEETIVEILERLIADAKSGSLIALAWATVMDRDKDTIAIANVSVGTGWGGPEGAMHALSDGIGMLHKRFDKETRRNRW